MGGVCLAMLLLTTGWHYEVLRALGTVLPRRAASGRGRMLVVLLGIVVAHAVEVLLYAAAYYLLARQAWVGALGGSAAPSFNVSLYFSLETFSSLGYGDVVPTGALRLLAGGEALNGLLLVGWSACYVHAVLDFFPAQVVERGDQDHDRQRAQPRCRFSTTIPPAERRYSLHRAR
jgi:hypothetical protein